MMRKPHLAIALLFTVSTVFLTGCPHKEYTLTMSTKGNVLKRKLTVKFVETGDEEKLKTSNRIAKLYNHDSVKKVDEEITFEGQFKGKTPNDIGGNGSIVYDSCQYGSITGYVENFGGSDDLAEQVKTRTDAANELINIFQLTLKRKFGDMEEFAKLDKFVDTQLRKDFKTLLLLIWKTKNQLAEVKPGFPEPTTDSKKTDDTMPPPIEILYARVAQFLLRHNYVPQQNAAILLYGLEPSDSIPPQNIIRSFCANILVKKVGIKKDGQLALAVINFITNPNMECSIACLKTAKSTVGFQKFKNQYLLKQAEKPTEGKEKKLDDPAKLAMHIANEYTNSLFNSAWGWGEGVSDSLTASLAVPCKPMHTNGKWYEDKKLVAWHGPVRNDKLQAPAICYALWVEPDENAQTKQFGKVFLNEDDLMGYLMWSKGLTAEKATQWNDFLKTLTNKNIDSLLEFKFKDDEKLAFREHSAIRIIYKNITGKDAPESK